MTELHEGECSNLIQSFYSKDSKWRAGLTRWWFDIESQRRLEVFTFLLNHREMALIDRTDCTFPPCDREPGCLCWRRCVALYCSSRKLNARFPTFVSMAPAQKPRPSWEGAGPATKRRKVKRTLKLTVGFTVCVGKEGFTEESGVRKSCYPDYEARLHVARMGSLEWCTLRLRYNKKNHGYLLYLG